MRVRIEFKTEKGEYKSFVRLFNNEAHVQRFIDKMGREFGWKCIGQINI